MPAADAARFADLYDAHRSKIWLYCRRRLGVDGADDAMGDVFLIAWRRIREAPEPAQALPWLYRIAYLTVSNHWRSFARRRRLSSKVRSMGMSPPDSPVEQVVVREEVRLVVGLLDSLRKSDAEVLRLAAWEQLSTAEIGSVLGVSPDTAKKRLSRARKRLYDLYEKERSTAFEFPIFGNEVSGEL